MHIGVDVRKFLNLFMDKINKYQFFKTFVRNTIAQEQALFLHWKFASFPKDFSSNLHFFANENLINQKKTHFRAHPSVTFPEMGWTDRDRWSFPITHNHDVNMTHFLQNLAIMIVSDCGSYFEERSKKYTIHLWWSQNHLV